MLTILQAQQRDLIELSLRVGRGVRTPPPAYNAEQAQARIADLEAGRTGHVDDVDGHEAASNNPATYWADIWICCGWAGILICA